MVVKKMFPMLLLILVVVDYYYYYYYCCCCCGNKPDTRSRTEPDCYPASSSSGSSSNSSSSSCSCSSSYTALVIFPIVHMRNENDQISIFKNNVYGVQKHNYFLYFDSMNRREVLRNRSVVAHYRARRAPGCLSRPALLLCF